MIFNISKFGHTIKSYVEKYMIEMLIWIIGQKEFKSIFSISHKPLGQNRPKLKIIAQYFFLSHLSTQKSAIAK